jgi:hypothetical protein
MPDVLLNRGDRRQHSAEAEIHQIDTGNRNRNVTADYHALVEETIDEVHERVVVTAVGGVPELWIVGR